MKSFSFPLLLLAVLSFSIVGCGGEATTPASGGDDTTSESGGEGSEDAGAAEEGGEEASEDK